MPLREAGNGTSVKQSRQRPPGINLLIETVLAGKMAGFGNIGALEGGEFDGDVSVFKIEGWLHDNFNFSTMKQYGHTSVTILPHCTASVKSSLEIYGINIWNGLGKNCVPYENDAV